MVLDPSSIKMFPGEMADGRMHPVLLGQQRHRAGDPIVAIGHRQTFKERYSHAGLFRHLAPQDGPKLLMIPKKHCMMGKFGQGQQAQRFRLRSLARFIHHYLADLGRLLLIQGLQQRRAPRRDAGAEDHVRLTHLGCARLGQGHVVLRTALLKVRASDPRGPEPIIGLATGQSLLGGFFPGGGMAAPMPGEATEMWWNGLNLEGLDARMVHLFGHRKVLPFRVRAIDAQHPQTALGLFQNLPTHGALTAILQAPCQTSSMKHVAASRDHIRLGL
mmetsp:Transcript_26119/g.42334  ORF Transcript_26119/g.42334 Transcript_26119/m.42334 type:complete len:274 (-) Transcript_26119:1348-2169(-)